LREFLSWLEASLLGHLMRETGTWTYAIVNLSHVLGTSTLFGSVLVLDLRLLGLWRRTPIAAIADPAVPVAVVGFAVAAMTGLGLLATKATDYAGNPLLTVKLFAITFGLVNVAVLNLSPAWQARRARELTQAETRQLARLGGISLACWLTAITAGRMIAYW
jgi:hypothetical protein